MNQYSINGTVVTIDVDGDFLHLRTYSRQHPNHKRFVLFRTNFLDWLESETDGTYYDKDIGNFLEARKVAGSPQTGDSVRFTFTWLSGCADRLTGFQEQIDIPIRNMLPVLYGTRKEIKMLYYDKPDRGSFDFSCAERTLAQILPDPLLRRAFSKALRDNFRTDTGCSYRFYNDFSKSFGFQETGRWRYSGGLILHEGKVETKRGAFPTRQYSVHT